MSGTGPRENVFPTRQALTNTKSRLKSAQNGHSLLAKKRDALTMRFRAILRKVDEVCCNAIAAYPTLLTVLMPLYRSFVLDAPFTAFSLDIASFFSLT